MITFTITNGMVQAFILGMFIGMGIVAIILRGEE